MEAIAALALAGNIAQFLDFSTKLCRTISEICHSGSGASKHNADTETLTVAFASSLDAVSEDLSKYCAYLGGDAATEGNAPGQGDIRAVVNGCRDVALDMLGRLEKLKVGKGAGKRKSFLVAVKALWREKEIFEAEQKLGRFRTELQWAIVVSLRKSLDLLESRQEDQFQRLQSSMSAILSQIIQVNSKTFPEWTVGPSPGQDLSASRSAPAVRHTIDFLSETESETSSDEANSSEQQGPEARLASDIAAKFASAEKAVLDSLAFPVMRDRETEIAAAESATFDWIFRDPRPTDRPWSNFHSWLSGHDSDGLYWVSGKAGSGKSTLMKHLVRHERTNHALRQWAGGTKLLLSSFFFWYSGRDLQKSQIGLLRALLYSCLKNHRELIPIAVPDTATLFGDDLQTHWTLPRLREALDRLVSQTFFDIKFAFFIDGLDEYAGSYGDIIGILKRAAARSNVKVCASSRPLLAFERAFESSPHLILQSLTYNDISLYVNNKLSNHDRMISLEVDEPGLRADLSSAITIKASGVFLWVYLVVGSLLDGLGNYDVGADLKRRLDDLPAELEALYWHMVDRVKPVWYLEEGFRLLRMVKASPDGVTLLRLCLAEMRNDMVYSRGLLTEPSLERQETLCQDMAGRLKSRCLGLLEAPGDDADPTRQVASFIHKSVFDFLETDAAQSRIKACPGQNTFQPEVALLRASILELKTLPSRGNDRFTRMDWFKGLRPAICDCIKLALAAQAASGLPTVKLLEELKATADAIWGLVEPRTGDEESGRVHWISAHKLSTAAVRVSRPGNTRSFEELLEGPPRFGQPGSIKSFDELCRMAGLRLHGTVSAGESRARLPTSRFSWYTGKWRQSPDRPNTGVFARPATHDPEQRSSRQSGSKSRADEEEADRFASDRSRFLKPDRGPVSLRRSSILPTPPPPRSRPVEGAGRRVSSFIAVILGRRNQEGTQGIEG